MNHTPHPLRWSIALLLLATLTLGVVSVAGATTLLKLTVEQMAAKSERIVRGDVTAMETVKEQGRVVTRVTLSVREHLKGPEDTDEVTFRVLGGRMGDRVTRVHGTPDFDRGEHVLVFLEQPNPKVGYVVTGMAQGKFSIAEDPQTKQLYTIPALEPTPLVERVELENAEGEIERRVRAAAPSDAHSGPQALDVLRARIDEATRAGEAR